MDAIIASIGDLATLSASELAGLAASNVVKGLRFMVEASKCGRCGRSILAQSLNVVQDEEISSENQKSENSCILCMRS